MKLIHGEFVNFMHCLTVCLVQFILMGEQPVPDYDAIDTAVSGVVLQIQWRLSHLLCFRAEAAGDTGRRG